MITLSSVWLQYIPKPSADIKVLFNTMNMMQCYTEAHSTAQLLKKIIVLNKRT